MRFSSFQIENFKSFANSGELTFSKGFNILIGQNNAGKTALLQALSLNFKASPHKSQATIPISGAVHEKLSNCTVRISTNGTELKKSLLDNNVDISIAVPEEETNPTRSRGKDLLKELFNQSDLSFRLNTYVHANNPTMSIFPAMIPAHNQYKGKILSRTEYEAFMFSPTSDRENFFYQQQRSHAQKNDMSVEVAKLFKSRIYLFNAERYNMGSCPAGGETVLTSNASNLADVLLSLQGRNPALFNKFNELVHKIFPSIFRVTAILKNNREVDILLWNIPPVTEREDLTVPLSQSGTGIGQVLAILYVALCSPFPRTILIDEPNSFLHPSAARKLIEILCSQAPQHQYIVSTHSPEIIRTANPSTLHLIKWENGESKIQSLEPKSLADAQNCLREVGVKLSDVFGADQILWVEGPTEETCYQMIFERLFEQPVLDVSVEAVRSTGDFEGKRSNTKLIWEIYENLSQGNALIPPAIGFIFDREDRDSSEIESLKERSSGKVKFLTRRMFENYLLCPEALRAVLNELPSFQESPVTLEKIRAWIEANGGDIKYDQQQSEMRNLQDENWLSKVHGAKLLADLFTTLSENKEEYRKTTHGPHLTDWLIKNKPDFLEKLKKELEACLISLEAPQS